MKRGLRYDFIAISLVALGFVLWSTAFIRLSSFMTIDGHRSYSLFDDAMISMRYAWNLSHGNGLVWNKGQPIQGYTNLLMTLLMSVATLFLSKPTAVLSIQISGVLFMLLIGWLTMQIADHMLNVPKGRLKHFLRVMAFASGLGYFPLIYWSLMGMETGLETVLILSGVLCALQYRESRKRRAIFGSAICFGLAFLTRNDTAIFFIVTWLYLAREIRQWNSRSANRQLLTASGVVFGTACLELLFQYLYYGAMLPNTYTLKLTGMPVLFRLQNGIAFVLPFVKQTWFLMFLAGLGLVLCYQTEKMLLALIVALALVYQVYVGGDAWNYWRMLSPAIPLAMILGIEGLSQVVQISISRLRQFNREPNANRDSARELFTAWSVGLFWIVAIGVADAPFYSQIALMVSPYQAFENMVHVNTAIALNEVLRGHATIGVLWAGTIPYYTDYEAVDFLGKSDKYIASLPPDLSGSVSRDALFSLPGHNKYDLTYSIVGLRPTYVEDFKWGNQDLSTWAQARYVATQYKGITLPLLRESPDVRWDMLTVP